VFWAAHRLGAAISPANPAYTAPELAYQLNDACAIALVTFSALLPTALKAIEEVPAISPERVYLIDGTHHKSQQTVEEMIQKGRKDQEPLAPLNLKKGESKTRLAFLSYSSGTTGLPKGVMISHYNVLSNVLQAALVMKPFDDTKRDMTLAFLPFYHIYGTFSIDSLKLGLVYVLHTEIYLGNTCVVVPSFDFPSFLSYIEKYRLTKLFLVPPLAIRLVKDPLTEKYDLSSMEQITSGAAPLGGDTMNLMRSKFKGIVFKQCIPLLTALT
jgi:4-coumarate--CoA ligase